jgi:GTP-binding protein Era
VGGLPYGLTVEIERYEEFEDITKIYAIIWTERPSQKNIIIGTEGEVLKKLGQMQGERH